MQAISENLAHILSAISDSAREAGRLPDSVRVMAVSKTHPVEVIQEAVDAGQLIFGENRVQEAQPKITALPAKLHWHLIGHLQSNKVRLALPLFELIHGVDSLDLLAHIDRVAADLGLFPRELLQVKVAGEAWKFGFAPGKLLEVVEQIVEFDRVQIEALMTIAPRAPAADHSRRYFVTLRELRDKLATEFRFPCPEPSMGMGEDFRFAVEE